MRPCRSTGQGHYGRAAPQRAGKVRWRRRVTAVILAVLAGLASCIPSRAGLSPEKLTVASPRLEQAALIYVAAERGYFARNGLEVVVQDHPSGVATIDALARDEVDIAAAAEYPFVGLALKGEPVSVLATIDRFENDYVVARRASGIATLADLKGKRVGVARGTIAEFYLARLLELRGIGMHEITLVDVPPNRFQAALAGGEVDALVAWQPYVARIQQAGDVVAFPAQSGQAVFGVLAARDEWLDGHAGTVGRFLKALLEAEEYIARDPAGAQSIVERRLGYDPAYLEAVWPQHQFFLALEQPLVIAMKDEAQWMIRSGLVTEQELPDFGAHLRARDLLTAKPGAVNLIP